MQVLVVSPGPNREAVKSAMSRWSIDLLCCSDVHEAKVLLPSSNPSLVFCEEQLSDGTYRDLLQDIGRVQKVRLVVMSESNDLDQAFNEVSAFGAFEIIASPARPTDVQWITIRAMQEESRRSGRRRQREAPKMPPESRPENGETPDEAPNTHH